MAIDTAEKRKSISGISLPFFAPGVTPNSSKDQEWRQESAWSYSGILAGSIITFDWSWLLEAYISGAWVDISADVMSHDTAIVAERGIEGNAITSRVAGIGSLTLALDNGESNSAGLIGYYSLDHANARANFGLDTPVRLKIVVNGTEYVRWRGYVQDLEPTVGRFKQRVSYLSAADYMKKLTEHKLDGIPVQENQRPDQLIDTVLDNVPAAPASTSLAVDSLNLPLALHSEQDEKSTAMSAIQKICQTSLNYVWIEGDEVLVMQRGITRFSQSSSYTFDNTMSDISPARSTNNVKNKLIGTIFPARVDSEPTTLLASLSSEFPIDAGATLTITMRVRDPEGGSNRVSGKDFVTSLVADTHYRMSAFAESGDNDMNAYLVPTVTAGGNTISVQVQNTGSVRGFISKMDIYGSGIYLYDPIDIIVESGAGDKVQNFDLYYLADHNIARDFITSLHKRTSVEHLDVESVSYFSDASLDMMTRAATLDIGDRITLKEYVSGLDGDYTINKVRFEITTKGLFKVTYECEWCPDTYTFFTVQDPVLGEIDNASYVLSPF